MSARSFFCSIDTWRALANILRAAAYSQERPSLTRRPWYNMTSGLLMRYHASVTLACIADACCQALDDAAVRAKS